MDKFYLDLQVTLYKWLTWQTGPQKVGSSSPVSVESFLSYLVGGQPSKFTP